MVLISLLFNYVILPFIGHLCNKVKRLIKSIFIKNKCMFDLKFMFVSYFIIAVLLQTFLRKKYHF